MLSLVITHVRPIPVLEYDSYFWNIGYQVQYLGNMRMPESAQRSWTRKIDGMTELTYKGCLHALYLCILCAWMPNTCWFNLPKHWNIFASEYSFSPEDLFSPAPYRYTCGHQFKITHQHTSNDLRLFYFLLKICSSGDFFAWQCFWFPSSFQISPSQHSWRYFVWLGGVLDDSFAQLFLFDTAQSLW